MASAPLSRREAKDLTRRRLLGAALQILDTEGEAGLSASKVARRAGIAQSSFYVHFRDKNDLLRSLGDEAGSRLRRATRDARRRARAAPTDEERHRAAFRVPLEEICRHPELFRLSLRARLDPASPLAEFGAELTATNRAHLVEDLIALGFPADSERSRRRLEMIADGLAALTEAMATGHLEGRYPDLEEAVDVLVSFSRGYLTLLPDARSRGSADPAAAPPP